MCCGGFRAPGSSSVALLGASGLWASWYRRSGMAPAGFTLLGLLGFGLTAMRSRVSDLRVYPFDVSVGSFLLVGAKFPSVVSYGYGGWAAGWLRGLLLVGFLIGCHFQVVCAGCFVLWLALRIVSGIGLVNGLSVDWNVFCSF